MRKSLFRVKSLHSFDFDFFKMAYPTNSIGNYAAREISENGYFNF